MKKIALFTLCLTAAAAVLWAEKPRRTFEFGVDAALGFQHNFTGPMGIFTGGRAPELDLEKLARLSLDTGFSVDGRTFFALNIKETWQFRLYAGVEGLFYSGVSQEIIELLSKAGPDQAGSKRTASFGASVFADAGLSGAKTFGRWTVGLNPAFFVPIVYAKKQTVTVNLKTQDDFSADISADMSIYTAIPARTDPSLAIELSGFPEIMGGVDLGGFVEYGFFRFLDLGLSLDQLPIVPAVMKHRLHAALQYQVDLGSQSSPRDKLIDGGFNLELKSLEDALGYRSDNEKEIRVYRPLRFDFYARYRPLDLKSLKIGLRPSLGLSLFTVYDEPCFNAGLEARLDLGRICSLTLASRLREKLWRQSLALEINLKVLELDFAIASQSADFVGSFQAKGIGAAVGFRLGW